MDNGNRYCEALTRAVINMQYDEYRESILDDYICSNLSPKHWVCCFNTLLVRMHRSEYATDYMRMYSFLLGIYKTENILAILNCNDDDVHLETISNWLIVASSTNAVASVIAILKLHGKFITDGAMAASLLIASDHGHSEVVSALLDCEHSDVSASPFAFIHSEAYNASVMKGHRVVSEILRKKCGQFIFKRRNPVRVCRK